MSNLKSTWGSIIELPKKTKVKILKKKCCFVAQKCKFEAKEEKKLEDHIKKKHGAIQCAVCNDVF
jgi:hypothetical protein